MPNALHAAAQVIALVRAHEDVFHHGDGCSPDTIARAEHEMGLTFPPWWWNTGVLDGGLMEKIADSFGEFALTECHQKLSWS